MNKQKLFDISVIAIGIVAVGILAIFAFEKLIPIFSPFLIAWAVALAVRGPAKKLSRKIHVPERVLRVFLSIFITLIAFGVIAILIWQITAMLWRFISDIGEGNAIYEFFTRLTDPDLPIFGDGIPPELADRLSEALGSMISEALSRIASVLTSLVSSIPKSLLFLLVTVISLIYFSIDLEKINSTVARVVPVKLRKTLREARENLFKVVLGYAKSYILIMLITFAEVFLGFVLIRVEHAPLLALMVAFLDILPVIGVGTVLIPWSIFCFLGGNHMRGIGLLILFVVIAVVRQFIEPRIVGKNLNLHPVLTLVFLYVGYALFGIIGLLTVPILAVAVSALIKEKHSTEIGERPT